MDIASVISFFLATALETLCVCNRCFSVCAAQETSWTTMCPQQCVFVYQGLNLCLCTEICCCSNFGLVKRLVEMSSRWLVFYENSTFTKYTSHWRMKCINRLHNFYGAVLQSQSLCGRQINSLSAFTRRSRLLYHVRYHKMSHKEPCQFHDF